MSNTPPMGGVPMVPTVATVSRQLQGLNSAMFGARNDIDKIIERQKTIAEDVAALRKRLVDEPVLAALPLAPKPAEEAPRPSLAAQAARKTAGVSRHILMALGVLGVASQIAAQFRPGMVGPIQTLIELLQAIGGAR